MTGDRFQAGRTPEASKEDSEAPEQEWSYIPARIRRRNGLCGIGLACPRIEYAGKGACSLLIEDGGSDDIRGSALVALIRVGLQNGCHCVFPDLATPCDTGLFD